MTSKTVIVLMIVIAAVAAVPAPAPAGAGWPGLGTWGQGGWGAPGANNFLPPWVAAAPWFPQWTPCTTVGSSCVDCNTKLVCTKVGGLQRTCTDPKLPYCNAGECSATPSAECAVPVTPA